MKNLDEYGRLEFAILPTPLYRLDNLSRCTGCNIYIKRDDMTGVALGGNKVRKLEYLLYDAKKQGCRVAVTTGGIQSNHAMLTAACCSRIGMKAVLVLKGKKPEKNTGNLILDDIMGAKVRFVDSDSYSAVYSEMNRIADALRASGEDPYMIPLGGSVPIGCLGYVRCAREIAEQTEQLGVRMDHIVCTAGSGGTLAGLAAGAKLYLGCDVIGIAVGEGDFSAIAHELAMETGHLLGEHIDTLPETVNFMGGGYAVPSAQGNAAIRLMAQKEGIVLDPVYTGKCMAGLMELISSGRFRKGANILFLHSGGAGGLFA